MSTKCTILTNNHSIYAHSSALVDEFNHILSMHEQQILSFIDNKTIFSKIDFFSSVFNFWVQLIESEELRVPKIDKMMIHTFSFELHKMMKQHPLTIKFLHNKPCNEMIFIFSCMFACKFLSYLQETMQPKLLERFLESKEHISYFKSTDDELQNQLLSDLFIFRKNLLVELNNQTDSRRHFNHILYESILLTTKYMENIEQTG